MQPSPVIFGLGITEGVLVALLAPVASIITTIVVQRMLWKTKMLEAEKEAESVKAQLAQSELQLTLDAGGKLRDDLWRKIERLEEQQREMEKIQAELERTIEAMRHERMLDVQVRLTLRSILEGYPNPPGPPAIPSAVRRVLRISADTDDIIRAQPE